MKDESKSMLKVLHKICEKNMKDAINFFESKLWENVKESIEFIAKNEDIDL